MQVNDNPLQYPYPPERLIELAIAHIEAQFKHEGPLSSPQSAADYLRLKLSLRDRECFSMLSLCTRHYVLSFDILFEGTINGATVHPREVVKLALHRNAGAVILSHNHPSGIPEPSQSDITLTKRLREALDIIDVRVLDHIVVGGADFVSMSDRGLL